VRHTGGFTAKTDKGAWLHTPIVFLSPKRAFLESVWHYSRIVYLSTVGRRLAFLTSKRKTCEGVLDVSHTNSLPVTWAGKRLAFLSIKRGKPDRGRVKSPMSNLSVTWADKRLAFLSIKWGWGGGVTSPTSSLSITCAGRRLAFPSIKSKIWEGARDATHKQSTCYLGR
jgi:hypothetical protein